MPNKINHAQQTRLVAAWEFMHFFKWKQEVVSKLIMIAIGLLVFLWQTVKDERQASYAVVYSTGVSLPATLGQFRFTKSELSNAELSTQIGQDKQWQVLLEQTEQTDGSQKIVLTSQDKQAWLSDLQQQLRTFYTERYTLQLGLSAQQFKVLNSPASFSQHYLDSTIKTHDGPSQATAIGMIVLLALAMFTCFGQIFASITGEKQQRVTEQLYACISAQTWIDGKILGTLCHGLKAMLSSGITALLGFAFTVVIIQSKSLNLSIIDWSLLPWLLIFSLAGLYLCTAFMAAIAAAIDDPNHSAKTSMMLLPLVPMILTFFTLDTPSGWALSFLSYFPLTSFVAMPVKMSLVAIPLWQPLVSLVCLIAVCLWLRGAAARLFKMGMTMYGQEPSLKVMAKWLLKGG